jgi:flagellar FliL protein
VAEAAKQAETPEPAQPASSGLKLALIAVLSLAGGTAAGAFGLGPVVSSALIGDGGQAAGDSAIAEKKEKKAKGGGHGEASSAEAVALYTIDNLVVNPAGTQGTRFLVVSLAVRLSDLGTNEEMLAHDPEIRDALLSLLSQRNVEQLSDPTARDSLKSVLQATIETVVGKGKITNILLPQFVLQ